MRGRNQPSTQSILLSTAFSALNLNDCLTPNGNGILTSNATELTVHGIFESFWAVDMYLAICSLLCS